MLELGMVDVSGRSDGNGDRCLQPGGKPARLPGSITRLIYSLGLSALQAESTSVDLSQLIFRNLVITMWGFGETSFRFTRASWGLSLAHCDRPGPLIVPFSTCASMHIVASFSYRIVLVLLR
jgi:hypothetical protein